VSLLVLLVCKYAPTIVPRPLTDPIMKLMSSPVEILPPLIVATLLQSVEDVFNEPVRVGVKAVLDVLDSPPLACKG
jgi:hypothetical protein